MTRSTEIKKGYKAITSASAADKPAAYVEFHQFINENDLAVDEIEAASKQNKSVLSAAQNVRRSTLYVGLDKTNLLRGSGMIVIGDHSGNILAADYALDENDRDLVAEKYPGYQKVALKKLAQAALLGDAGLDNIVQQYQKLQEILEEYGLTNPGEPSHHLGYAANVSLTAGVSGMLPSEAMAAELVRLSSAITLSDWRRGWVDWQYDEQAGFMDLIVADGILNPEFAPKLSSEITGGYLPALHEEGLNVN